MTVGHSIAANDPTTSDACLSRMLELARLANVSFQVIDGRLMMRCSRVNWKLWPPVRAYFDHVGLDALVAHLTKAAGRQGDGDRLAA